VLSAIAFAGQAAAGEGNLLNERSHHSTHGIKLYGTIEQMPEAGYAGVWVVNGREVSVTADTRIKDKHGIPETGAYVEVEGHYSGRELSAEEISVKRSGRTGKGSSFFISIPLHRI
jgi:hypothetical protein